MQSPSDHQELTLAKLLDTLELNHRAIPDFVKVDMKNWDSARIENFLTWGVDTSYGAARLGRSYLEDWVSPLGLHVMGLGSEGQSVQETLDPFVAFMTALIGGPDTYAQSLALANQHPDSRLPTSIKSLNSDFFGGTRRLTESADPAAPLPPPASGRDNPPRPSLT